MMKIMGEGPSWEQMSINYSVQQWWQQQCRDINETLELVGYLKENNKKRRKWEMIKWICWIPLQGGFLMASLNKFIFYFPTFLCYNFYARSHSHFPQEKNEGIKKKISTAWILFKTRNVCESSSSGSEERGKVIKLSEGMEIYYDSSRMNKNSFLLMLKALRQRFHIH